MDVEEAKHWGLVNHIVPKGKGLTKAGEIVDKLTKAIKSVLTDKDKKMRQNSRNRSLSLANVEKNTDERLRLML